MVTAGIWPEWLTLSGMVLAVMVGDRGQRHQRAVGAGDIEPVQGGGVALILRQQLQDHLILVGRAC